MCLFIVVQKLSETSTWARIRPQWPTNVNLGRKVKSVYFTSVWAHQLNLFQVNLAACLRWLSTLLTMSISDVIGWEVSALRSKGRISPFPVYRSLYRGQNNAVTTLPCATVHSCDIRPYGGTITWLVQQQLQPRAWSMHVDVRLANDATWSDNVGLCYRCVLDRRQVRRFAIKPWHHVEVNEYNAPNQLLLLFSSILWSLNVHWDKEKTRNLRNSEMQDEGRTERDKSGWWIETDCMMRQVINGSSLDWSHFVFLSV